MKPVKKCLCLLFSLLMLLTAVTFTGCKQKREILWVYCGESNNIPCVAIPDGQYATYEEFKYILRKANQPGIPEEWGFREKVVEDPQKQIVNKDCGGGVYLTRYKNTTPAIYHRLIDDMKLAEFTVISQGNLNEDVFTTSLSYKGNSYTVSYYTKKNTSDVSVVGDQLPSPHLQKENYSTKAAELPDGKTSLYMRPLCDNSIGYVVQLKNGNFVVMDDGSVWDLNGLLTFLEENTPAGQIPVVEAWFTSIGSYETTGWANGFYDTASELKNLPYLFEPTLARDRVRVNGLYLNTPMTDAFNMTVFRREEKDGTTYFRRSASKNDYHARLATAAAVLKTQDGQQTPVYNPLVGQTYYFNGLTVDVLYTEEHNAMDDYGLDFKTTTTCYQLNAEGRTVLDLGCAGETIQKNMLSLYSDGYLNNPDVLVAPWRGTYLCKTYQDVFAAPITLIPIKNQSKLTGESAQVAQAYAENGKCYYFSDGTVVYDFATGKATVK